MVNTVELGETIDIAYKYCKKGELSGFLRDLIVEYDEKQQNHKQNGKQLVKTLFIQNMIYLFSAITLIIYGLSLLLDLVSALSIGLIMLCGFLLFINGLLNMKTRKEVLNGY